MPILQPNLRHWHPPFNWRFLQHGCWGLWVINDSVGTIDNVSLLYDISGNNRHATLDLQNAGDLTMKPGPYGWCTEHDGGVSPNHAGWQTAAGDIPSSATYTTALCMCFHKYDNALDSTNDYAFLGAFQLSNSEYGNIGDDTHWGVNSSGTANTHLRNRVIVNNVEYTYQWDNAVLDGEWHVYACLYDGASLISFRSGEQSPSSTSVGADAGGWVRFPTEYNRLGIAVRTDENTGLPGQLGWIGLWLNHTWNAAQVAAITGSLAADPYGFLRSRALVYDGPGQQSRIRRGGYVT